MSNMDLAIRTERNKVQYYKHQQPQVVRILRKMLAEKRTLEEIGQELGVTRERARQVINDFKKEIDPKNLEREWKYWTLSEVAKLLDISAPSLYSTLNKLEAEGLVFWTVRKISDLHKKRLFTKSQVKKLKKVLADRELERQNIICKVCGKKVPTSKKLKGKRICSHACLKKYTRDLQHIPFNQINSVSWIKKVWTELNSMEKVFTTQEDWLSVGEASRLTGLSKMQIIYLGSRGVLTTMPHPSKTWGAMPVVTYSKTQLFIAQRIAIKEGVIAREP